MSAPDFTGGLRPFGRRAVLIAPRDKDPYPRGGIKTKRKRGAPEAPRGSPSRERSVGGRGGSCYIGGTGKTLKAGARIMAMRVREKTARAALVSKAAPSLQTGRA